MANRVTGAEVKGIIDTAKTATQVEEYITGANLLVTDILASANYSTALLKEIERYLAAHFVAVDDPRVSSKKFGDASATFHGKSEMGLNHTPQGQQVLMLDYKGNFAAIQEAKRPAEFVAIDFSTTS